MLDTTLAIERDTEAEGREKRSVVLPLARIFTTPGRDVFDEVEWDKRTIVTRGMNGASHEEKGCEFPIFWSANAANIAGSKYFRGRLGSDARERSVKQMIGRVVSTIRAWGLKFGYFDSETEAEIFSDELTHILLFQKAAFNSPVWFNLGVEEHPQCSACQPYRALVSAPAGFFPIGEIVEKNMIGLPVYDSCGITRVVAVKNNGTKAVYRVTLGNGSFVEATGDHLVRAVDERRTSPQWLRVDQLKRGMRMHLYPHREILSPSTMAQVVTHENIAVAGSEDVITRQIVATGMPLTELEVSKAALAGWLQADGFVGQYRKGTNRSLTAEFIAVTKEEQQWIEFHLNVVFPNVHRKVRMTKTESGTSVTRIRLYGESLRPFVEEYELLRRRRDIRVPAIVQRGGPNVARSYLKSVFQAEGFVRINGRSVHLALDTISKTWMEGLQVLLYGMGIYSRLRVKKDKRENRFDLYELDISYGSERKRFAERIGFLGGQKQQKLMESSAILEQKEVPDLREEEITAIDEVGKETVYDIQTASGEYLSNNVVVHNCFILSVEDSLQSILGWLHTEGMIFKGGSGAGVNLSPLRSTKETLSKGGMSSGPVSFMRGADSVAGMIASGGSTRRAAKMVVLNIDHPDIMSFIRCKADEEKKVRALMAAGYDMQDLNNEGWKSIQYQNANNSVRVTDDFMKAAEADDVWTTHFVTSGDVAEEFKARELLREIAQAAWECGDPGMQFDTTVNDWNTAANTGRINATNPCGEYVHLDNSACNLSSINLLKFLNEDGTFRVEEFLQTVRIMILAQEIIVGGSSYPTEKIGKNARAFRELGLGYANLGALLMAMGLPYDSDSGRESAAAITALMTGEAYRYSAEIARKVGPFEGFGVNREPMLRVLKKHRGAMQSIRRAEVFDPKIYDAALNSWNESLYTSEQFGVRNSQVSVIAPTGTISLMMDCDTTGVEPEFALVKTKSLVGGGIMKFVNRTVPRALKRLGYNGEEISAILEYIEKNGTTEGAPILKSEHLAVFDCAVKPTNGARSISWQGHVKMVAAAQPFISGGLSKTFNMPNETTVEEIMEAYIMAWKLGIKAFAVYRDGSKSAQPLVTSTGKGGAAKPQQTVMSLGPVRRHLPPTRGSETHKFSIAGHEGYLTYSIHDDGEVAEIFIRMAKTGSTLAGLLDAFAITVSMSLQYSVPLKELARKFIYGRYEPAGFTDNPQIQIATSITDYIFRYLAIRFLNEENLAELGINGYAATPAETLPPVNHAPKIVATQATVFADSVCRACGGMMIQTGSCKTCLQCGTSNGGC